MNASPRDVERLSSREALVGASGGHPVIRLDTGPGLHLPALGLPGSTAVAWSQTWTDGRRGVQFLGGPDEVRAMLTSPTFGAWFEDQAPVHVTAPRLAYDPVDDVLPVSGGNTWDWMWTATAPTRLPAEGRVDDLRGDEHDALAVFLSAHNPDTHAVPFARETQQWVVVRDDSGRIIACGCSEPGNAAVPLLGGITVEPARRGEGLGAGLTAYLTREAIERTGASTLGVFEENAFARELYTRLGYQVGYAARTRFVGNPADA